MTKEAIWRTRSKSQTETEKLAEKLARNLQGGEVIELVSDLGGGKTTFVRGLVRGLGSSNTVNSPTFKICNVYHSPSLTVYHFDLYRLTDPGLVRLELAEAIEDTQAVTLVEWATVAADVLPKEHLIVKFEYASDNDRFLSFHFPTSFNYLMAGLAP